MKKYSVVLGILFAIAFIGCSEKNSYQIKGTVVGDVYEGSTVYLQEAVGRDLVALDSAIVEGGKFLISGVVEEVRILFLSLDGMLNPEMISRVPVVVEPGVISVEFGETVEVKGTKLNTLYKDYMDEQESFTDEVVPIIERYQRAAQDGSFVENPELEGEIMAEYNAVNERVKSKNIDFIKENIDNVLGLFVFNNYAGGLDLDTQKDILSSAGELFHNDDEVKRLLTRIENAEKVAIGQSFVDFTMKDTEGNDVSLSDYAGKGKVVLIDFWAAWCGPCRNEMPNVVDAYNKFKNKGFEVVGVSLDRTHEEWIEGIKSLQMEWPQMSDMKFWETPVVDLYAFQGIPHTVLLDSEGVIIEKNLRGQALHDKLSELLD